MKPKFENRFKVLTSYGPGEHGEELNRFVKNVNDNGGALVNTQFQVTENGGPDSAPQYHTQIHYLMPIATNAKIYKAGRAKKL